MTPVGSDKVELVSLVELPMGCVLVPVSLVELPMGRVLVPVGNGRVMEMLRLVGMPGADGSTMVGNCSRLLSVEMSVCAPAPAAEMATSRRLMVRIVGRGSWS